MRVECRIDSITDAGVEVSFRVRGFPLALRVTRIIMDSAPAEKWKVRPPAGFRKADPDPGYSSVEEFAGDYLGDRPNATPERIQRAWQAEQRRLKKENAGLCVFNGQLALKWFGETRLFIPMDVSQTGTINFVFAYSRKSGLLLHTAMSSTGAEVTLPGGMDGTLARA